MMASEVFVNAFHNFANDLIDGDRGLQENDEGSKVFPNKLYTHVFVTCPLIPRRNVVKCRYILEQSNP